MTPPVDNRTGQPSLILPRNQPDPAVRGGTCSNNVRSSIDTAVVDYNHFVEKRKRLEGTLNSLEKTFDVSGLVQCGHGQGKLFVLKILHTRLER
jgi:hypothetical protein